MQLLNIIDYHITTSILALCYSTKLANFKY